MFSSESLSSISLATVTPSLVIVGEPNFFSITTLRPLGPSVTFTASANILTPRRIACRESSPCRICFAIVLLLLPAQMLVKCLNEAPEAPIMRRSRGIRHEVLLLEDAEDFFFTHDQQLFAVQLDLCARVLAKQNVVASLHVEREYLAFVVRFALTDREHLALLRLLFCRIRDDDAADLALAFFNAPDQNPVVQRCKRCCRHCFTLLVSILWRTGTPSALHCATSPGNFAGTCHKVG